jgi:hypothetical protein
VVVHRSGTGGSWRGCRGALGHGEAWGGALGGGQRPEAWVVSGAFMSVADSAGLEASAMCHRGWCLRMSCAWSGCNRIRHGDLPATVLQRRVEERSGCCSVWVAMKNAHGC